MSQQWYVVYGDSACTAYMTDLQADGPYEAGSDELLASWEAHRQEHEIVAILPENVWTAMRWGCTWYERSRSAASMK